MNSTNAQIAAHLTAHIARISPRHDLVVTLDDHLDTDARYCPATSVITLNLGRLVHPDDRPQLAPRPTAVLKFPAVRGALARAAGHADHTRPHAFPSPVADWMAILEEPRIDRIQLAHDDPAVRGAVPCWPLLESTEPTDALDAIRLFIRVVGRMLAGALDAAAAWQSVTRAVVLLPDDDAALLRTLTVEAIGLNDDDHEQQAALAEQVHAIARRNLGEATTSGSGAASDDQPPTTAPSANTAEDLRLRPPSSFYDGPRNARLRRARLQSSRTSDWLTVRPLPAESYTARAAAPDDYATAAQLKSRLLGNQELDDLDVTVPWQAPPGSIDMAELVRATAQHDLGLRVTASPWHRTLTRSEPSAPIDLGLIVDTSGSMRAQMDRVATAGWALDRAVPTQTGRVQTWVFNAAAYTLPTVGPDQIAVPHAADATDALLPALHDYTRWARPCGTSRVLVILSDGMLSGDPVRDELVRVADVGVRVVGLVPHRRFVEHLSYHLPDNVDVDVMADDVVAQLAEMLIQ